MGEKNEITKLRAENKSLKEELAVFEIAIEDERKELVCSNKMLDEAVNEIVYMTEEGCLGRCYKCSNNGDCLAPKQNSDKIKTALREKVKEK